MMKPFLICATLVFCAGSVHAQCTGHERNVATRVSCDAADDLQQLLAASDHGIPRQLLDKAACVIVVPNLKKGGFVVGAEYGRGIFSCRRETGVGWSAPGYVKVVGGKFGFLIGGAEADVVMLVMNKDGMRHLTTNKFQLGGEVSAAAGPVGRNASALTDAEMRAEILTYSRQRGIFGGLDLSGSAVTQDSDAIFEAYGEHLQNRDIVMGDMHTPQAGLPFTKALSQFSSRK